MATVWPGSFGFETVVQMVLGLIDCKEYQECPCDPVPMLGLLNEMPALAPHPLGGVYLPCLPAGGGCVDLVREVTGVYERDDGPDVNAGCVFVLDLLVQLAECVPRLRVTWTAVQHGVVDEPVLAIPAPCPDEILETIGLHVHSHREDSALLGNGRAGRSSRVSRP